MTQKFGIMYYVVTTKFEERRKLTHLVSKSNLKDLRCGKKNYVEMCVYYVQSSKSLMSSFKKSRTLNI